MTSHRPSVVIVGAGMAGLAAAVKLVEVDMFEVIVLEATDRPGGRIHTSCQGSRNIEGTEVIELGAQWIHGEDNNPLYHLAKNNGLLKGDSSCSNISDSNSSNKTIDCEYVLSSREWSKTAAEEGVFILEDGTLAPPKTVQKVCMWYDNLCKRISDDSASHNGCTSFGELVTKSMERMLEEEGITNEQERCVYWRLAHWCMMQECLDCACESCNDISLAHFNDYCPCPGEYYTPLGKKGFQGVVDLFLNKLPSDMIRYCQPVDQISWKHDPVTDQVTNNSTCTATNEAQRVVIHVKGHPDITADHVIITSSVGYLKENHVSMFEPILPSDKQKAISSLGFGTVDKIFLKFKSPFWEYLGEGEFEGIQLLWENDSWHEEIPVTDKRMEDPKNKWIWKIPGFYFLEGHNDVLCAWISGKEAEYMEQLSDAEVGKICTGILQKFLQREIPSPTQVVMSRWGNHPYFRGSYSGYLPVHGTGEEYDIMSCPVFEERAEKDGQKIQYPVLLFAGEACHKQFQSTVHGAMVTGEKQAEKLIQFHESPTK